MIHDSTGSAGAIFPTEKTDMFFIKLFGLILIIAILMGAGALLFCLSKLEEEIDEEIKNPEKK